MVYVWSDQETIDDLNYKLLSIKHELESVKKRANEERSKHEEITKQLVHLLKVTCQDRDETKDQLQKRLKCLKVFLPISADEIIPMFSDVNNETIQFCIQPQISTVKESDVISYPTIPTEYNFAADSSNLGFSMSAAIQGCDESIQVATMSSSKSKIIDRADVLIAGIDRVRSLPKKGRLYQAVMEIEPLLQTLLVAPLPKWRNPPPPLPKWRNPPPLPPLKSSSNLIYGCDFGSQGQGSSSLGFSHIPSSSALNFAKGSASMSTPSW